MNNKDKQQLAKLILSKKEQQSQADFKKLFNNDLEQLDKPAMSKNRARAIQENGKLFSDFVAEFKTIDELKTFMSRVIIDQDDLGISGNREKPYVTFTKEFNQFFAKDFSYKRLLMSAASTEYQHQYLFGIIAKTFLNDELEAINKDCKMVIKGIQAISFKTPQRQKQIRDNIKDRVENKMDAYKYEMHYKGSYLQRFIKMNNAVLRRGMSTLNLQKSTIKGVTFWDGENIAVSPRAAAESMGPLGTWSWKHDHREWLQAFSEKTRVKNYRYAMAKVIGKHNTNELINEINNVYANLFLLPLGNHQHQTGRKRLSMMHEKLKNNAYYKQLMDTATQEFKLKRNKSLPAAMQPKTANRKHIIGQFLSELDAEFEVFKITAKDNPRYKELTKEWNLVEKKPAKVSKMALMPNVSDSPDSPLGVWD